ncbi:MAG: M48 family metalloprotease [Rhodanobacteraceae bacterium]
MSPVRATTALAVACITALSAARGGDVRLPDIGSSAGTIMTQQDQREYGAAVLHELRSYGLVLDDALLNDYITSLGFRLVSNSDRPDLPFNFFLMRDEQINAFAVPGGYIFTYTGLLTAMAREDDVAAVLAHEISHVTQQHLLRAFEDMQKMSLPVMLGMLGVLIATQGRTDDAGTAAIMTGTSLMQQRQINFTRHDEAEADRVGIQALARSGFDPLAMADAFSTLQRVMRVNGIDVPEFLLDHPVDTRRIADAKSRAEHLECPKAVPVPHVESTHPAGTLNLNLPDAPTVAAASESEQEASAVAASDAATTTIEKDSPKAETLPRVSVNACGVRARGGESYFELMRERARVLSTNSIVTLRAYYADNLRTNPSFDTPANHYGYALTLTMTHDAQGALTELRKLVAQKPDSSVYRLGLADALDQAGSVQESLRIYDQLNADFPGNRAVTQSYADSLLSRGDEKSSHRAQELLRPLVEHYPDDPDLQKSYGRACQLAGDKVRAAEAYAEAAYLNGNAEDALNQLKTLVKQPELTFYQRSRVDARITRLTPEVLALRKRGTPEDPTAEAPGSRMSCCQRR